MSDITERKIIEEIQCWISEVVIKHNFCPFAHKPFKQKRIRYFVASAQQESDLVDDLIDELLGLAEADPEDFETSIFIIPDCLQEFVDYNQFIDVIDEILKHTSLKSIIQVATFHPAYRFSGSDAEDVRNYTNRSPYPMFHLIREDSVEKARQTYSEVESIPRKNMTVLEVLGLETIRAQLKACKEKD